jgi:hypothetical protein
MHVPSVVEVAMAKPNFIIFAPVSSKNACQASPGDQSPMHKL